MIAIKYALFAVMSTLINLLFQYFCIFFYSGQASLYFAMLIGTLAGLIVKYILDKKYIFYHKPHNKNDDAKKFLLYSFMGIFTTLIFWGFEITFNALFHSSYAKYFGAAIGLSVGYVIKYYLDKKYVFTHQEKLSHEPF